MASERRKLRRAYLPKVEALEVLRLLDASPSLVVPISTEHFTLENLIEPSESALSPSHDAWDAALGETRLDDILGSVSPRENSSSVVGSDNTQSSAIESGYEQLNRYLSRTWYCAKVDRQQHEDCTQGVYARMLQVVGRDRFDQMLGNVGQEGITQVMSRDESLGRDFYRAIDLMKKRTLREKTFHPLDDQGDFVGRVGSDGAAETWRGALQEAIQQSLNPREARLIQATLQGYSPSEIADQWGVAAKTVSNEKTRAIAKLREALTAELCD